MSPPDTPVTLDDVAEFHQQLLRMDRAGLKVQLDDSGGVTTNLPARLNEILARLASQAGKSASLEQAIVAAEFLPDRYRLALRTYIGKPSTSALALLRGPIQHDTEGAADLRLAMVLPVILLGLIYLGLFYLLLVTLPRLESIYAQLNSEPSLPVQWLMRVRAAMPFWVPGVPVIVLVLWWVLSSGRFGLPRGCRVASNRFAISSHRCEHVVWRIIWRILRTTQLITLRNGLARQCLLGRSPRQPTPIPRNVQARLVSRCRSSA